jgi:ribosome-associated protein
MEESHIVINQNLSIAAEEIRFRFSRSSGPGGQNVNRIESKVELLFDVSNSDSLKESQRRILLERLGSKLDSDGVLHIVDQSHRSQSRNREEAVSKFQSILEDALKPRKKRRPTRPSRASKERRLQDKKKQGQKKQTRRKVDLD